MSGKDEGIQQHLTAAGAGKSTYFHCFAHKLNLVLEKSVNNVPSVNDVFDIIGCVYRYLGSPKRHALYEEKLQAHGISKGKIALNTHFQTQDGPLDPTTWRLFSTLYLLSYPCSKQCLKRANQLQMDCSYECKSSGSLLRVLY